ncbi:class I SAM-dependent methyltransferase [Hellea balneolensis]|uniref:class I SAM-dependent methyltransferase n=1 Tax=Hellea balneolensis TaxID=287478 RepID=UPI0004249035|nr:class I SAM-dependent methyltransferase [Hellea balneolensis]
MTASHEQDWDNYWQGRAAQSSGEALIGVGIEDNARLSAFWIQIFQAMPKTARIADFACGAGSALKHAHGAGFSDLTGIDIAADAINVLKKAIPSVKGCVSSVTSTPFIDDTFDGLVSQFGFEYAGGEKDVLATAREMARLMSPSGVFAAIAHMKGGAIEKESLVSLNNIQQVIDSNFISCAQDMFRAAYAADESLSPQTQEASLKSLIAMGQAEGKIVLWLRSAEAKGNEFARFAHYLVTSTREMFERRKMLPLKECLQWLEDMEGETMAYQGRMKSMVEAALSKEMTQKIMTVFADSGFETSEPEPFYFDPSELPVAWTLRAKR